MIYIDNNEPKEFDYYLSQTCQIKRDNFNQSPNQTDIWPDFTVLAGGKSIGVNRKQAGELLGGLDAWKDQVRRELGSPNIDYLYCVYEGAFTEDSTGIWCWDLQSPTIKPYRSGNGADAIITGFHSQWSYKHLMSTFVRSPVLGVPIIPTNSIVGTSVFLAELHSIAEREDWHNDIFDKLIKHKYVISEAEKIKRDFILFLMGIPGVGEEAASSLANEFDTFSELYDFMGVGSIKDFVMGSGRKIGPALEKKIKSFWGME